MDHFYDMQSIHCFGVASYSFKSLMLTKAAFITLHNTLSNIVK